MTPAKRKGTLHDYLDRGEQAVSLTFDSFSQRFGDFLVAHNLSEKVDIAERRELFDIAAQHLREQSGMRAMDRDTLEKDFRNTEKLIRESNDHLTAFLGVLKQHETKGPVTASLAQSVTEEVRRLQAELSRLSFSMRHKIQGYKSMLSAIDQTRKAAGQELMIDLIAYIEAVFPEWAQREKDALIGATFAGAGLYDEKTLADDPGAVERIPMKVSRAKGRLKRFYGSPDESRVYPSVVIRRTRARRANKPTVKKQQTENKTNRRGNLDRKNVG
jgi:hypothetical protein